MSALPDEHPAAADTAATSPVDSQPQHDEVRNLYSIPRPEPKTQSTEDEGLLSRLMGEFTPPQWWTESTPSPAEEFNRAKHGRHLQATGPMRRAAIAYAAIAAALNTKDKAKIWVRSHPARLVIAAVLMGLLLASPARPIVAWVVFGLPHLAFEALAG